LSDAQVPAIWLGLTDATVENGCLRVVPRSHRLGMLSHRIRQTHRDLASSGMSDCEPGSADGDDNELSVKLAQVPEGLEPPFDVVMKAGEMSFHHPLALHGSNPNASPGPRIGLSATYSTPSLYRPGTAVALVRGSVGPQPWFPLSGEPADLPLENAVAAYRASGRQVLDGPG
jgi:ectoine hydroxylase-related dioxygenase (phytanoyl-CoA dioxygenase family)